MDGKPEQTTHNFAPTKTPDDMIAFESEDLIHLHAARTTTSSGNPFQVWRFSISIYELPEFFQTSIFCQSYLDGKSEQYHYIFVPSNDQNS